MAQLILSAYSQITNKASLQELAALIVMNRKRHVLCETLKNIFYNLKKKYLQELANEHNNVTAKQIYELNEYENVEFRDWFLQLTNIHDIVKEIIDVVCNL